MVSECRIGLIADTHGLIRPAALDFLRGCERIIHAGDIGSHAVLEALAEIAPVTAVRGNIDRDPWAAGLPLTEVVQVGDRYLYVLHDLADLDLDPAAAGFHAVIAGHSHRPAHVVKDEVHYINPGSAGPRRFKLPVSLASMRVVEGHFVIEFRTLDAPA